MAPGTQRLARDTAHCTRSMSAAETGWRNGTDVVDARRTTDSTVRKEQKSRPNLTNAISPDPRNNKPSLVSSLRIRLSPDSTSPWAARSFSTTPPAVHKWRVNVVFLEQHGLIRPTDRGCSSRLQIRAPTAFNRNTPSRDLRITTSGQTEETWCETAATIDALKSTVT